MKALALASIAAVTTISLLASLGFGPRYFRFVNDIPGGDVTAHFVLMALVGFAVAAWLGESPGERWRKVARGTAIVLAFVTLDEVSQIVIPARRFTPVDLAASWAGVLGGTALALGLLARRSSAG